MNRTLRSRPKFVSLTTTGYSERLLAAVLLVVGLAGCIPAKAQAPLGDVLGFFGKTDPVAEARAQARSAVEDSARYVVRGMVEWPYAYRIAADPTIVNRQATVSMIEQASGIAVAAGLTDTTGAFNLAVGAYAPKTGAIFLLEATKGLNAQLPGNSAIRMRTLMQWTGATWLSCTNAVAGTVAINQLTTAVAIQVGLGNVAPEQTIGTVNNTVTPPAMAVASINGIPAAEFLTLATDVKSFIVADLDAVAQTNAYLPSITSVSPTAGSAGTVVAIQGNGFVTMAGATTVPFQSASGTVSASVLLVTPHQVYVQVPNGALTGTIKVNTTRGQSNGVTFAVNNGSIVAILTLGPNPISPGSNISVMGSGFAIPAGNNAVEFVISGGATASGTVVSGDTSSLAVTVPQNAASGPVRVANASGKSNAVFLNVSVTGFPVINEVFPNKGTTNNDVILNGILFGAKQGTVTIGGYPALIRQWRDTQVRIRVPWQVPPGATKINVVNSSLQGVSADWTVLNGTVQVGLFTQILTLPPPAYRPQTIPVFSGKNLYFVGGGNTSAIHRLTLAADGGAGVFTANIGNTAVNLNTPDGHSHTDTWLGDRYWVFNNNADTQKAYMEFQPNGDFKASYIAGPAFSLLNGVEFYTHDTAIAGGPFGIYMAGSDTAGSAAYDSCLYTLYDKDVNYISTWSKLNLPSGAGVLVEDLQAIVLENTLWIFGGTGAVGVGNYQMVSPLDAKGKPTGIKNLGTAPCGGRGQSHVVLSGNNLYKFGECGLLSVSKTPLISGTYPQDYTGSWPTEVSPVSFAFESEAIIIGGWAYFVGSNTNVYAAPIL